MEATLKVIHILLALGLIGVVIVQRASSDGGGLMGGGSSSLGGLMTARGTANLLTRITAILATAFIITSIVLTILAGNHSAARSLVDQIKPTTPVEQKSDAPAAPQQSIPSVPVSK